jgi:hypothetical protein
MAASTPRKKLSRMPVSKVIVFHIVGAAEPSGGRL